MIAWHSVVPMPAMLAIQAVAFPWSGLRGYRGVQMRCSGFESSEISTWQQVSPRDRRGECMQMRYARGLAHVVASVES